MENKKIKLVFYHIEKTAGSSLRDYLYNILIKKFEKKTILYEDDDIYNLNNHKYIINNYNVVLHHVYYSDILYNNTFLNIICLRDPVDRLISHYHFFDSKKINYENLLDFKKNDYKKFTEYCNFIGNLQFLKLSGYFDEIIELSNDYVNIFNFMSSILINETLKNKICSQLSTFDAVLIFEKLNIQGLLIINNNNNKYNYTEEFKNELKTYCQQDYFIYDQFKDSELNNLDHILDKF